MFLPCRRVSPNFRLAFALDFCIFETMKITNSKKQQSGAAIRLKARAQDEDNRSEYRFQIEFLVFQENGVYVSYCPALDISSSGKSFNEAIGNFYEMFQLHIECCIENNTLHDDLLAHGWVLDKEDVFPPKFSSLVRKKELQRLLNGSFGFEKVVGSVRIPAFA